MSQAERRRKVARKISSQSMLDNAPSIGKQSNYLKLPAGVSFFRPKEDKTYRLLFLPWASGKGNPRGEDVDVENRYLFIHKQIGPNEESFACLAKTIDKPCPICESFIKLRQQGKNFDDIKDLRYKNREFFLIHDLEGDKGNLQCWEESAALFGDFLRGRMGNSPGRKAFASPDGGMVVEVKGRKKPIGQQSCVEFVFIDFVERTEEEQAKIDKLLEKIEKLPCPDEWVKVTPYEKLKKLFDSTAGDEEEEPEPDEEPDDSDEEEPEPDEEEESAPKSKTKTKPKDEEEDEEPDDSDEEEEPEPDEDEDDTDEDEDDTDEDEEEPAPPKKKTTTKKKGTK